MNVSKVKLVKFKKTKMDCLNALQTFHLFDAAEGILEGVQCGGLVVFLVSWHVKLQLFQSFNHLLLGFGFCRLLTTARWTREQVKFQ